MPGSYIVTYKYSYINKYTSTYNVFVVGVGAWKYMVNLITIEALVFSFP